MADVVVIGAGVVGAAIAYRLACAGTQVAVVDRAAPGRGTSSTSFAWVNSNSKPPLAYHQLNAESMMAHRRLRDDLGAAPWLHEGGSLEWVESAAGQEQLLAKVARLREWGYRVQELDASQAQALEPHLRLNGFVAGAHYPDEAWVEGPAFAADVAAAAAKRGATVHAGDGVAGIARRGDHVTGVRLESGARIAAPWVVVATGRWTDRVAALAGVAVPLAPTCGLLAVTGPVGAAVSRVVHAPGVHFRPEPGGRLVVQANDIDETVSAETPADPPPSGCVELLRRAQRFVPSLVDARIVEARVGIRPMPADGFSIVGPVSGRVGLYLAVTHSGVTLAPLLGEIVARELTAGQEDERLAPFRPARCVRTGG